MESRLQTEIAQRSLTARDMDFVYEAQSYIRKGQKQVQTVQGMMIV